MKLVDARRARLARRLVGAALAGAAIAVLALRAGGTAQTWGNGVEPLRWPEDKTINVYIEPDPDGVGSDRSALIKEGMDRWASVLSGRGITLTVTVGAVPTDPTPPNLVRVLYKPVSTEQTETKLVLGGDNHMCAKCGARDDKLVDGEVLVRDDIAAGTDAEKENLRNLGQHEITHILGLADDESGKVTKHTQGDTPNTFNDTDLKELDTLYPLPPADPPKADGETQQSLDPNVYDWDFEYAGAPGGHVALITMDVDAELIEEIETPKGWIHLDPSDPLRTSQGYPYYQGYLEDGAPSRPPWDPSVMPPLAFRALSEADTLSTANPTLSIRLRTVGAQRGAMRVWAGGAVQVLEGPIPGAGIPVLPTWSLVLLGGLGAGMGAWSLRARRAPAEA